jgi:NAD(P)-dependent dehydrogenase (short-subunit alcohol dehydrogenase family)
MGQAVYSNRFEDKVVLVAGAGGGLGRATALAFANEGAKFALADINEVANLESLKLAEKGGRKGDRYHVEWRRHGQRCKYGCADRR